MNTSTSRPAPRWRLVLLLLAVASLGLAVLAFHWRAPPPPDSQPPSRTVWTCHVGGHIESGPLLAGGRVYLTAGDDGLQAVRADTGGPLWGYHGSGHVDATPWMEDGRLYGGSGVSRMYRQSEAFCLDAKT